MTGVNKNGCLKCLYYEIDQRLCGKGEVFYSPSLEECFKSKPRIEADPNEKAKINSLGSNPSEGEIRRH